jgi:hypothetical protein
MKSVYIRKAIDILYAVARDATKKEMSDWPESEEFYNLMQAYRHAPMEDQKAVVDAYEAVKEYLRGLY